MELLAPHPADVCDAGSAGQIAVVVRSGVIESRHLGHAVLVDPDGRIITSVGDPSTPLFPRSAIKPWQAAACRRAGAMFGGAPLDGEALAIAAGSHVGTARHLDLVAAMLADADLTEGDLQCPAVVPADPDTAAAYARRGDGPTRLAYNCSGKHAGMLLACRANDWSRDDHLVPEHPLQDAVRRWLETAVDSPVLATVVDGCGAPQFAVPLLGLARAAGRLHMGDEHARATTAAMRAHPWAVQGPGRSDTVLMEQVDGLVAKAGADGVQLLATADGWAVVVKVLDGAARAALPAALDLLSLVPGLDLDAVREEVREPVLGGGHPVGEVIPTLTGY